MRDKLPTAAKHHIDTKHPHWKRHTTSSRKEHSSPDDPILAVVTVPLSSVNIEDDEDKVLPSDGEESISLTPWKYRKGKTHDYNNRDETSSTNINLPLRMVGCSSTSFGSISLNITVKAPRQTSTAASTSQPNKSQSENGTAEESIEIGALARIMQSWAIYDSTATDSDNLNTKSSRNKRRMPHPRFHKKRWNRKTKRWSQLKLNAHGNSRDSSSDQANWFAFLKWSDEK